MLKSLEALDRREVERILSGLTVSLLPDPGIGARSPLLTVDPQIYSTVMKDIQHYLRISPSDLSPKNRAKVLEFLSSQMTRVALADADLNRVKTRLGQRGDLRPDQYEIEYLRSFWISEQHGVRRNHVADVLRRPDAVQHLPAMSEESPALYIYIKAENKVKGNDRFSLLVLANRVGFGQRVIFGFRLYHSDIELPSMSSPLNGLRALIDRYGVEMKADTLTSKLIQDEFVSVEPGTTPQEVARPQAPESTSLYMFLQVRTTHLVNVYAVSLAFALDQKRYAADLRRHGVHVPDADYTKLSFTKDE